MTTGTPDLHPAGTPVPAPDPRDGIRTGPMRWWWLRFQGRVEGAVAHPDPRSADPPISSRGAATLRARLFRTRSALWDRYFDDEARRATELAEIAVREQHARARFEATEELLDRTRRATPTEDTARPTEGEAVHRRSADVVLRRRRREHAAELETRQRDRDRARSALDEIEQRRSALAGAGEHQHHRTAIREHLLIGVFLEERSIHDRALVLRHPRGDELADRLDASAPDLSAWAADALDRRGGSDG